MFSEAPCSSAPFSDIVLDDDTPIAPEPEPEPETLTEPVDPITPGPWVRRG